MICFKDRTFCKFWKNCKNANSCDKKLTEDIKECAASYGLPISVFTEKPDCFECKGKCSNCTCDKE